MARLPSPSTSPTDRRWFLVGVVTLVVGAAIFGIHVALWLRVETQYGHPLFEDWWNASNAADRLLSGSYIYNPIQLAGPYLGPSLTLEGFAYPPPAAALFILFRGLPLGLVLWLSLNVGLLISGLAAVVRAELGAYSGRAMPFMLAGLLAFPAFANGLMWANLNVGLAGLFAWSWVERARWTALGSGIGGLLKIYPAAIALWRVRSDGWVSPLAQAVVIAAGICVATLPFVGVESWRDFATAISNSQPACLTENASLVCVLKDGLGTSGARLVASIAAALIVLAAAVVIPNKPWAFALMVIGIVAAAPDIHYHYWIFAYVAFVAITAHFLRLRLERTGSSLPRQARPT